MTVSPTARLRAASRHMGGRLAGRADTARLVVLAAAAGQHLLLVGPPGTGKSALCRGLADCIDLEEEDEHRQQQQQQQQGREQRQQGREQQQDLMPESEPAGWLLPCGGGRQAEERRAGCHFFERLLGRFTVPEDLIGESSVILLTPPLVPH